MSGINYLETAPTLTHGCYGLAVATQWAVLAELGPVIAQLPASGQPVRAAYDRLVTHQRALSETFDGLLDALDRSSDKALRGEVFAVLSGGAA